MFRPLLLQLLGLAVSLYPLVGFLISLAKKGLRKTLEVKERPLPPKTLTDERWGEHRYARMSYFI